MQRRTLITASGALALGASPLQALAIGSTVISLWLALVPGKRTG